MRVVCISDTHGRHASLDIPDGDLLIHAGDLTDHGEWDLLESFDRWLETLAHPHKVVIAGNHDFCFEREPERAASMLSNATYLQDSSATVDGLRIYGSPWQPWFYDWAFNLGRGAEIAARWAAIPTDTDILVTHGPPLGSGDRVVRSAEQVGCADLLRALDRVRPRLHVFGHIHEGYGRYDRPDLILVNASSCTVEYRPTNPPIVVDL